MIMIAGLFVVYANRYTFISCDDIIKKNLFVFFMQTLRYVAVGYDNVYIVRDRKRWPRMYCTSDPHYFFLCLPLLNSFDVSNFNVESSVNAFSIGLLFNKISIFKWSFPCRKKDLIERQVWAFSKSYLYNKFATNGKIIHIFIVILALDEYLQRWEAKWHRILNYWKKILCDGLLSF